MAYDRKDRIVIGPRGKMLLDYFRQHPGAGVSDFCREFSIVCDFDRKAFGIAAFRLFKAGLVTRQWIEHTYQYTVKG